MSVINRAKLNRLVDAVSGLPLVHGDYYRPADRIIDLLHAEGFTGDTVSEIFTYPSILTGLVVTIGAGSTTLNITSGIAIGTDSQNISITEHNYDGVPLTGLDATTGYTHPVNNNSGLTQIPRFIVLTTNLINQSTSSVANSSAGFVKVRYKDQNLFTRNTPSDPTATPYSFLTRDSYELIIDQIAPTTADVCLANFTKDAFGAITSVTTTNRDKATATQIKNSALDFPNGRRLTFDAAALTADRTYTLQDADMTIASVAQVNAVIPTGTRMLFQQTAAPVGWTKEVGATFNDRALRIVTGAVGNGGTNSFTTAFNSNNGAAAGTTGATTLALAQIPSHNHGGGNHSHSGSLGAFYFDGNAGGGQQPVPGGGGGFNVPAFTTNASGNVISTQGTGGSHTHTIASAQFNLDVAYHDVIIATKN